jgi:hypothetical protein
MLMILARNREIVFPHSRNAAIYLSHLNGMGTRAREGAGAATRRDKHHVSSVPHVPFIICHVAIVTLSRRLSIRFWWMRVGVSLHIAPRCGAVVAGRR